MEKKERYAEEFEAKLAGLREKLESIHQFDAKTLAKMTRDGKTIDARISLNDEKVTLYDTLKDNAKSSPMNRLELAVDIFAENFSILNEKLSTYQFFLEDIYTRIETLGKATVLANNTLHQLLKKEDAHD